MLTHALWGLRSRFVPGGYHSPKPTLGPDVAPYGRLSVNYTQWASYRYARPAGGCHSIYRLLGSGTTPPYKKVGMVPPPEIHRQHPQWFWPRDGPLGNESQVYGQVCWSNQSLVNFLIDRVKLYLQQEPGEHETNSLLACWLRFHTLKGRCCRC